MDSSISISSIFPILIFFQCFFFGLVLLTYKGLKKNSNTFLAFLLITLGIQLFFLTIEDIFQVNLFEYDLFCFFGYTYGPFLFLYVVSLTKNNFAFRSKHLIHFLTPLLFLGDIVFNYSLCPNFSPFIYLSLIIYITLSVRILIKYNRKVHKGQSLISKVDLRWLLEIIAVFSFILLLSTVDRFLLNLNLKFNVSLVHFFVFVFVNWICYKALKYPYIFQDLSLKNKFLRQRNRKRKEEDFNDDTQHELNAISKYFEENLPYLNAELSLKGLALELSISPRRLSYLINTYHNKDFMNFINDYRIDLAKKRLKNPTSNQETILEVMYDVGFNSKSSFNTFFKKSTGLTPTEYKKRTPDKNNLH